MRLQILELPSVVNGDSVEQPFVIVLDQSTHPDLGDPGRQANLRAIKEAVGARAIAEFRETVEIVR